MRQRGSVRTRGPVPGRAPWLAELLLVMTWLVVLAGARPTPIALAGATPWDALDYLDPAVAEAREDLAARERAQSLPPGVDVTIYASPSLSYGTLVPGVVTYGDVPGSPAAPGWAAGVSLAATVGYSYDPVLLLDERIALEQARADVASARRRGVFRALTAHAALLQAQAAVEQDTVERDRVVKDRTEKDSAEFGRVGADGELGASGGAPRADVGAAPGRAPAGWVPADPPPVAATTLEVTAEVPPSGSPSSDARLAEARLAEARLSLAALELRLDEDVQRLAVRRLRAAAYGLDGDAGYARLRFVLPEADQERTSRYRIAALELARSRAELRRQLAFGVVQNAALTASYVSGNVGMTARGGVVDGRPRAELGVAMPSGSDGWSLGVSATIVLSGDLLRLPEAERRVQRAQGRLDGQLRDVPARIAGLRAEATFAERELDLSEQRLALAERAQVRVLDARRGLYDAWIRYLGSVYAYLDAVEAPWQAR